MATIKPIEYTTKAGNLTLSELAKKELKGKTTLTVLNALNAKWKGKKIPIKTEILYLSTTNYNKYRTQKAEAAKKAADQKKKDAEADTQKTPPNGNKHAGKNKKFKGLTVIAGQWGVLTTIGTMTYYSKEKNGKLKKAGTLKKGEVLRVMGKDDKLNTYILEKSRHVLKKDAATFNYAEVPIDLNGEGGSATPDKTPSKTTTDAADMQKIFEMPSYRRPMLRYKDKKGKYSKIVELRLNSVGQNLMTELNPMRTNAGWYLQVSGEGLSTMTLNGFLVDSKGLKEFTAFMHVYHAFLKAKKSGDYVKIPTIKFNYKNREYTAIVRALSTMDAAEARLRVTYQMELIILAEKVLGAGAIKELPSYTNPNLENTESYYTNLKALFRNTVTGQASSGT